MYLCVECVLYKYIYVWAYVRNVVRANGNKSRVEQRLWKWDKIPAHRLNCVYVCMFAYVRSSCVTSNRIACKRMKITHKKPENCVIWKIVSEM